jgi:hypothetical protein
VLRACLIRASNARANHIDGARSSGILVLGPGTSHWPLTPSNPSGGGSRQDRWTSTQMSRQVASAVIGEASLTVVGVRWGFASEGRRRRSPTGDLDQRRRLVISPGQS